MHNIDPFNLLGYYQAPSTPTHPAAATSTSSRDTDPLPKHRHSRAAENVVGSVANIQHELHGAGFKMVHQNGPARLSEWQWSCCEFAIPTATSPNQTLRERELDSNQVLVRGFCIIIPLSKMSQYLHSPIILVLGSLSMSLPTTFDLYAHF